MSRRRKEKFRPILPRSGPCLTPKTPKAKTELVNLSSESVKNPLAQNPQQNHSPINNNNENVKDPNEVIEKSEIVVRTPKARRRKTVHTPVVKPKPLQKTASENVVLNTLGTKLVEPVCESEAQKFKESLESSQTELTELKSNLPPDKNKVNENSEDASFLGQTLLANKNQENTEQRSNDKPPFSSPTPKVDKFPTENVSPQYKSPPIPKHSNFHGRGSSKRLPNFEQASRIRHDSIRETVVKERHNRQKALTKLKMLEQKSKPDADGTKPKWPELDHNLISMSDLIYLNPPESTGKELGIRAKIRQMESVESNAASQASSTPKTKVSSDSVSQDDEEPSLTPQIRVNEDGTVVIDEESLTIKSTPKPSTYILDGPAVYESGLNHVITQTSFRRRPIARGSRWTVKETEKFYSALKVVGADFELMAAMFRHRKSDELRRKYHNESRRNCKKVDNALQQQHLSKWTDDMFQPVTSSEDEEKISKPAKKRRKTKLKKPASVDCSPEELETLSILPEADMSIAETVEVNTSAEDCDIVSQIISDIDNSAVPVS